MTYRARIVVQRNCESLQPIGDLPVNDAFKYEGGHGVVVAMAGSVLSDQLCEALQKKKGSVIAFMFTRHGDLGITDIQAFDRAALVDTAVKAEFTFTEI